MLKYHKKRLFFLLIFFFQISCSQKDISIPSVAINTKVDSKINEKSNNLYHLHIGDVIEVKFYYTPRLNERVTIRPDGYISLQLVDEIYAAGLTTSELDKILSESYKKELIKPELTVIVKEFTGQNIFVGGEVTNPGLIPISGKLTSLQAIFQAGGFKNTANSKNIVILRNQGGEKPKFMTVDLDDNMLINRINRKDVILQPYDVVYVPKSTIAKVTQFIDQYFVKLIPISKTFGFSYVFNLNPDLN